MANNQKVGGVEFEAAIDLAKFEKDQKKLIQLLRSFDTQTKKTEQALGSMEGKLGQAGEKAGKFGQKLDDAGKKLTLMQKIGKSVSGFFNSWFGQLATAYGLKRFIGSVLEASSALETMQKRAKIVFGDSLPKLEQALNKIAAATGRSSSDLLGFANDVGQLIDSSGIAGDALVDMSGKLTQLAVDMASVGGGSDEDALGALKLALAGGGKSLVTYGIKMDDAQVSAYALANGIKQKTSEMNLAQLMTLRYNYILDKTDKIQGDASKNTETFANQVKNLKGQWQDFLEALGGSGGLALASAGINVLMKMAEAAKIVNEQFAALIELLNIKSKQADTLNTKLGKKTAGGLGALGVLDIYRKAKATQSGNSNYGPGMPADMSEINALNKWKIEYEKKKSLEEQMAEAAKLGFAGEAEAAKETAEAAKELEEAEKKRLETDRERFDITLSILQAKKDLIGLTEDEERLLQRLQRRTGDIKSDYQAVTGEIKKATEALAEMNKESEKRVRGFQGDLSSLNADTAKELAEAVIEAEKTITELEKKQERNLTEEELARLKEARGVFRVGQEVGLGVEGSEDFIAEYKATLKKLQEEEKLNEAELIMKKAEEKKKEIETSIELEKAFQEERLDEWMKENEGKLTETQKEHAEELRSKQEQLQSELTLNQQTQVQITAMLLGELAIRDTASEAFKNSEVARFQQIVAAANAAAAAMASARNASRSVGGVKKAAGGFITGIGGPTDDAIPAMLSNGEYVVRAAATKMYLPLLESINAMRRPFAQGGVVTNDSSRKINLTQHFQGVGANIMSNPRMIRWHLRRAL